MTQPTQAQIEADELAKKLAAVDYRKDIAGKDERGILFGLKIEERDLIVAALAAAAQVGDATTVPLSVYESAVRGRQEMRQALRVAREQTDKYGVALMMIKEGCADPKEFAAKILTQAAAAQVGEPTVPQCFIECDQCGGSGFDTPGTGYGNVCGKCGGQKFLPVVGKTEHDLPPIHVVVERTIEAATIERCAQVAADWFTLAPQYRTKEKLLAAIRKLKDAP